MSLSWFLLTLLPLLLFLSPTFSTQLQNFPSSRRLLSAEPLKRSANRLGKPLIGDDGIIYACSGKFIYAFRSNGSIAWNMHLNYTCNGNIAPVYAGKRKVFIIAEDRLLVIDSLSIGAPERSIELFFANESAKERSDEIIGLSANMLTSSVYMNIRNKGLFAFSLRGKLRWSVSPMLNQSGFHQGCRKNVSDCHITSAPIVDHCEASIYISNNQGELYSISTRQPHFKWIQDLSSIDKEFTAIPGNNGHLYITMPNKALVLGLDASTGDILWQRSIGSLSSSHHLPVVDSNGWISVGSLDGFLYSISPLGMMKKFFKASPEDSVVQVSPILDCSGYGVYISQTVMEGKSSNMIGDYVFFSALKPKSVVFSLLVPVTESFYWSEVYPGQFSSNLSNSDLQNFLLDEEIVLAFIAAAKIGNPLACRSTRQKLDFSCSEASPESASVYTGDEKTIFLFLLSETLTLVILAIIVRFCCIFWSKRKLQNRDLGKFLEKRHSLWLKKKEFDQTISELEQKATEEPTTIEKLSSLVREREDLERKLSTTYSLGRDRANMHPKSVLPLYNDKARSYSFQGSTRENVTIFHNHGDSSSDEENSSRETDFERFVSREVEMVKMAKAKGKAKVDEQSETVSFCEEEESMDEYYCSSSGTSSESMSFYLSDEHKKTSVTYERESRTLLKRRRSLSLAN